MGKVCSSQILQGLEDFSKDSGFYFPAIGSYCKALSTERFTILKGQSGCTVENVLDRGRMGKR